MAQPYSTVHVRTGAIQAVVYSENRVPRAVAACPRGTVTSRRGREAHRHDYTRPPASLGDALGGLRIALGLFASPPLTFLTESVVVMEWKGMSAAIATWAWTSVSRCKPGKPKARNRHYSGP